MATETELRLELEHAEKAYLEIISGKGVRTLVDQNGERVEYGAANLLRLSNHIEGLKRQLGQGAVRGPMRVFF